MSKLLIAAISILLISIILLFSFFTDSVEFFNNKENEVFSQNNIKSENVVIENLNNSCLRVLNFNKSDFDTIFDQIKKINKSIFVNLIEKDVRDSTYLLFVINQQNHKIDEVKSFSDTVSRFKTSILELQDGDFEFTVGPFYENHIIDNATERLSVLNVEIKKFKNFEIIAHDVEVINLNEELYQEVKRLFVYNNYINFENCDASK